VTTIDGTRAAGTITLPGATLDRLDELGRILGRSPAELVTLAIATYAPALVTPAPQFATTVDAGDSRPQRPDVETGQGTSRPPAPVVVDEPKVLVDAAQRPYLACTEGGDRVHPATWVLAKRAFIDGCWGDDDPLAGFACCDDHIPDGWVRPAPPHVHLNDAPCVYAERCGQ